VTHLSANSCRASFSNFFITSPQQWLRGSWAWPPVKDLVAPATRLV